MTTFSSFVQISLSLGAITTRIDETDCPNKASRHPQIPLASSASVASTSDVSLEMALVATSDLHKPGSANANDPTVVAVEPSALETRFTTGSDADLRALYDEYGTFVYSLCRRSVDDAAAADITQEVFIAAWRNRGGYDIRRGGLGPWLAGITRNKIIDHYRANAREDRRVERVKNTPTPTSSDLEEVSLRMLLVDAIDELPDRARTVISMAFFDELTHVEIAAQTGIPLGTVKSDIRRGLDRLRHGLGYIHG